MGHIKSEKLDNGMIGLEITYGGPDAPFGGVDSAAPPMYIDPRCFVSSGNFGIFSQRLISMGWTSYGVTLNGWPAGAVDMIAHGSACFANIQYNWVLAAKDVANVVGPPRYVDWQYYFWIWPAPSVGPVNMTTSCIVRQFEIDNPATFATGSLSVYGATATVGGTVTVTVGAGAALPVTINIGDTPAVVATNIAAAINAVIGYPCTAVVDTGFTNQINLTATSSGFSGNNMTITIVNSQGGAGVIPTTVVNEGFSGGEPQLPSGFFGNVLNPCSWVQVGESLYFGGMASYILQFTFVNAAQLGVAAPILQPITQYLGARTLAKFNNQLIAVGIVPGPGQTIDAAEMIVAWSAPSEFGIWNPEFSDGTVTGAGFNQITDIADPLTGMLIVPGAAIVLRTQGIDYFSPLGGGVVPFDFSHMSNALKGEGCPDPRWVTQYDRVGFFIGNSDVYQFTGGIDAIGGKIKNLLIPATQGLGTSFDKAACSGCLQIAGDISTLVLWMIDDSVYMFNPQNESWMILPLTGTANLFSLIQFFCILSTSSYFQPAATGYAPIYAITDGNSRPTFWQLGPTVQNVDFPYGTAPFILFKQEEVAFGRDITIDSLLVSVAGTPGLVLNWTISGTLIGSLTLPATASPSVFTDYQVYFSTNPEDVTTVKNPQLRLDVAIQPTTTNNQLSFAKIALFGSFDPNQRPV